MLNVNIAYVAKLRIERFHFNRDFFFQYSERIRKFTRHISLFIPKMKKNGAEKTSYLFKLSKTKTN